MKRTQNKPQDHEASAPEDGPVGAKGLRPLATSVAYLVPPGIAAVAACLVVIWGTGAFGRLAASVALGGAMLAVGLAGGAFAGRAASGAERRAVTREYEQRLDDLDHDLRAPMTIIRGEVELVLSQDDIPAAERGRSSAEIVQQLEKLEGRLRQRYRT